MLSLKIKFEQDFSLTACAQYLQSKIDASNQPQAAIFVTEAHSSNTSGMAVTENFLYDPALDGEQIQKILTVLDVPGEVALKAVT